MHFVTAVSSNIKINELLRKDGFNPAISLEEKLSVDFPQQTMESIVSF